MEPITAISTVLGIGRGVMSIADYWKKRGMRTPTFASTYYGKLLKRRTETGTYNPRLQRKIFGRIGRMTGQAASESVASRRGELEKAGMGKSVAGLKYLREPELERIRKIGDITESIEIENELSKEKAKEEYARLRTAYSERATAEKRADVGELTSGIASALQTGIGIYSNLKSIGAREKYYESLEERYKENPLEFPEGFVDFSPGDLKLWAGKNKISYNEAKLIKDDMIAWEIINQDKMPGNVIPADFRTRKMQEQDYLRKRYR